MGMACEDSAESCYSLVPTPLMFGKRCKVNKARQLLVLFLRQVKFTTIY